MEMLTNNTNMLSSFSLPLADKMFGYGQSSTIPSPNTETPIQYLLPHFCPPLPMPAAYRPGFLTLPTTHHATMMHIQQLYSNRYHSQTTNSQPKPTQSYIGLIAMAILSAADKQLVLSDIYQWIVDNFVYFRMRGSGWKNSIRHNLSLNDCFIKADRCPNGKGHYWTIHPANMEDFIKGDFRRRRAQQKVKRHRQMLTLGVSRLADIDDDDSSPNVSDNDEELVSPASTCSYMSTEGIIAPHRYTNTPTMTSKPAKRPFDIDSLLGLHPEPKKSCKQLSFHC